MKIAFKAHRYSVVFLVSVLLSLPQLAQAQTVSNPNEGVGIDSQLIWSRPGPSNFATISSSDIVPHADVSFSALLGYSYNSLGMKNQSGDSVWLVENSFTSDFAWAFGLVDIFQLGLVLPITIYQDGDVRTPFAPGDEMDTTDYELANSSLRDIRFNIKTRFVGGNSKDPDKRDFGLSLDLGLAVPTGDEDNFSGNESAVFFPSAILDFHRCMLSVAVNVGARLYFSENKTRFANLDVGQQGTFGVGITGHFLKRSLLLSLEGSSFLEFEDLGTFAFEYRGGVGYIPGEEKSITLWLSAGSSASTTEYFVGAPAIRVLFGITYAPKAETANSVSLF
jgi:hypothetical protein